MSEGVRIRCRPDLRFPGGAMIVVTDHARPFSPPADGQRLEDVQPVCSLCAAQHFAKTYHIQLEGGAAVVSTGVWESLQRLADNPFVVAGTVVDPPAQNMRLVMDGGPQPIVRHGDLIVPNSN